MLADIHYDMLERLVDGVNFYECSEDEKVSIRHLEDLKMCRPHANIQRGLYKIEPLGRAALDTYHREVEAQLREKEALRLEMEARKQSELKDKLDKKIQIINLVISGVAVIIALAAFIKSFFFLGG